VVIRRAGAISNASPLLLTDLFQLCGSLKAEGRKAVQQKAVYRELKFIKSRKK
jgi:hypothetical protein